MIKSNIFFRTMLFTFIATMSYFIFIATFAIPKIENSIGSLEKRNAKDILDKVILLSNNVHYELLDHSKSIMRYKKKSLKNVTEIASGILHHYYDLTALGKLSTDEAKKLAYEKISQLKYNNDGYFFIIDDNYTLISHPNKDILKKNIANTKDDKGRFFIKEMIDKSRKNSESFVQYPWRDKNNQPFEKLTYIKKFEHWDIYIGTGVSIEDIKLEVVKRKENLFKQLIEIIKDTKIGNSGYVYIFKKDGTMIVHPNEKLVGMNIKKLKNPSSGNMLYDDLIYASQHDKKLKYIWDKPNDRDNYIYEKISWIEYLPELEWYVASSAYIDDLYSSANELKNNMYIWYRYFDTFFDHKFPLFQETI